MKIPFLCRSMAGSKEPGLFFLPIRVSQPRYLCIASFERTKAGTTMNMTEIKTYWNKRDNEVGQTGSQPP